MALNVVIMAGGVGSRLYPISTPEKPKQFLDLLGVGKTLIQLTYERFLSLDAQARFWVVTSGSYLGHVREQLPSIPREQILLEPCSRNTAPCLAYVCSKIQAIYGSTERVVVTPADAYVPAVEDFCKTIATAVSSCSGRIVTVGINPTCPSPEYGYIHAGEESGAVLKVSEFKEKPSVDVARGYLAQGGYFWNAGIFVFEVGTMLSELHAYAPEVCNLIDRIPCAEGEEEALEELFPQCPKISIDYAVMEKSSLVDVVPSSWPWDDLGSFEAIIKLTGRDPRNA